MLDLIPVRFCGTCGGSLDKSRTEGECVGSYSSVFIPCSKCDAWVHWAHVTGSLSPENKIKAQKESNEYLRSMSRR